MFDLTSKVDIPNNQMQIEGEHFNLPSDGVFIVKTSIFGHQ